MSSSVLALAREYVHSDLDSYCFMISLSKTVAKQLVSNENDSSTAGAAVFFPPSLSPTIH